VVSTKTSESINIQIIVIAEVVTVTTPEQLCPKSGKLLDCSVQVLSQLCSLLLFFPPMASPVCRPGLRSRQIVEPVPPTKSRKQVATEKAEKEVKEQKKNEGLKKIATVENAKAQEQEALTKTPYPALPPPKKPSKKTSQKRASSNPSSNVADLDHDHTALSEDIKMNQEHPSETEGVATVLLSDVPAEPPTHDDSASEMVSDLEAMQKKKQKMVSLRATVNELQDQLMAVDSEDNKASLSDGLNQETPMVMQVKRGHQSMDISVCPPIPNNHSLTESTLGW
jgi:hypothetical protein